MKLLKIILLFIGVLVSVSCEDDLNPFGEPDEKLILNCVLGGDRDTQIANFSRSYYVDNFDPYSYTDDNVIGDAHIRVWFEDSVKIFNDTIAQPGEGSKYEKPLKFYYHNSFVPAPDTDYEIEAALPDGRKLKSITHSPKLVKFSAAQSDTIIPPLEKDFVLIRWRSFEETPLYAASKFTFIYFKRENGINIRYVKDIPHKYEKHNGKNVPFFPEPSYISSIDVPLLTFETALEEIWDGVTPKEDYTILAFILETIIYDQNLTSYYASKAELEEGFSITVNEANYTNIEGGIGIFGSYIKQYRAIKFSHDYIRSFGYTPGLTE
ncbi:MAG: DUF4249 family protein [Melioribacteraceae bacterium]|nr:DUF4249 family protein [Melioribacteraceae bacterium]